MGRPRLEPGQAGEVEITGLYRDEQTGRWRAYGDDRPQPRKWEQVERWRARANYRGHDGVRGEVSRQIEGNRRKADVVADATATMGKALERRLSAYGGGSHDADALLVDVAHAWLEQISRSGSGKAPSTQRIYRLAVTSIIDAAGSGIRGLTLEQVNRPAVLRHFLQRVADEHGTGSAKQARTVLSGVLGQAVADGILPMNAVRSVGPVRASDGLTRQRRDAEEERDTERALTPEERERVLTYADTLAGDVAWERVSRKAWATADLVHFLAGTGVRIGEGLGLRWEQVDLDAATVHVKGTKTRAANRTLGLPAWLVERLRARGERTGTDGLVFPAPAAGDPEKPWDAANASRAVSAVLRGAGCSWATAHVFRRTVATRLHEAGVPLVKVADQLGHADPSVTMREYLGRARGTGSIDVAAHL